MDDFLRDFLIFVICGWVLFAVFVFLTPRKKEEVEDADEYDGV